MTKPFSVIYYLIRSGSNHTHALSHHAVSVTLLATTCRTLLVTGVAAATQHRVGVRGRAKLYMPRVPMGRLSVIDLLRREGAARPVTGHHTEASLDHRWYRVKLDHRAYALFYAVLQN